MKRLRVLHVIAGLDIGHAFGGAERSALELCRNLDRDQFEVSVCTFWRVGGEAEARWAQALRANGIPLFFATTHEQRRESRDYFAGVRCIVNWCKSNAVDIVHAHHEGGALAGLLAQRHESTRLVLRTVYVPLGEEWGRGFVGATLRLLFSRLVYPIALATEVSVSPDHQRKLDRRVVARLFNRHACLIYNTRPFRVREPQVKSNAHVIGSVGRLTEQKGHLYLIEALPQVIDAVPKVKLLLIGDGELRPALERRVAELSVSDHVEFMGWRNDDDVSNLLSTLDMFVMPSLWEGVPLALLEAIAAGVPVVATDIAGFREFLRPDYSAWLVPPRDEHGLGTAIVEALQQRTRAAEYARCAQEHVLPQFSMHAITEQYQSLYRSVAGATVT